MNWALSNVTKNAARAKKKFFLINRILCYKIYLPISHSLLINDPTNPVHDPSSFNVPKLSSLTGSRTYVKFMFSYLETCVFSKETGKVYKKIVSYL